MVWQFACQELIANINLFVLLLLMLMEVHMERWEMSNAKVFNNRLCI
jgi:hypothetical protein